MGLEQRELRAVLFAEVRLFWKCGREFWIGDVGKDLGNVAFNWVIGVQVR